MVSSFDNTHIYRVLVREQPVLRMAVLLLWPVLSVACVVSLSPRCDQGVCSLICPDDRPHVCMNGQQCDQDSDCGSDGYTAGYASESPEELITTNSQEAVSGTTVDINEKTSKNFSGKVYTSTFKYHVFAPMGRFQLELIYLYFPPSFHHTVVVSVL